MKRESGLTSDQIRNFYENGLGRDYIKTDFSHSLVAFAAALTLRESEVFRRTDNEAPVILSPASNRGSIEYMLQGLLPEARIIACDVSRLTRVHDSTGPFPVQADARNLPLKNESVDVILENLGALWHVLVSRKPYEALDRLLVSYHRVLKSCGPLIFDSVTESMVSPMENLFLHHGFHHKRQLTDEPWSFWIYTKKS